MSTKVGFIGLGSMGAPIARRLARSGFSVTGCDVSSAMLDAFDEPGTIRQADPIATARQSELLGICVRTDDQLQTLAGDGELFAALGKDGVVILHSTVSPQLAIQLTEKARSYGVGFVDVGVSGGGPAAIEGKLSLFVGASDSDIKKAWPWLEAIGSRISHLGPVGRGQQGKLLNNLISIANYGMSAAIVDLACELGFERDSFIEALNAGSAQSFALKVGPGFIVPREGRDRPEHFMDLYDLLKKDVDHCRDLPVGNSLALNGLLASCEVMLIRLRQAADAAASKPAPLSPLKVTERYFASVRAKALDEFVDLFAADATYTLPNGKQFMGHDAIREVQATVFSAGSPSPEILSRLTGPDSAVVEVVAHLTNGSVRNTCNVYRLNGDGKIKSLNIYMREV